MLPLFVFAAGFNNAKSALKNSRMPVVSKLLPAAAGCCCSWLLLALYCPERHVPKRQPDRHLAGLRLLAIAPLPQLAYLPPAMRGPIQFGPRRMEASYSAQCRIPIALYGRVQGAPAAALPGGVHPGPVPYACVI